MKQFTIILSLVFLAACTHQKVDVEKITDSGLSCQQLYEEIKDVKDVKNDIENKRGLSARNVGMGILFWPGIIVNEINGSDAEELAEKRLEKLTRRYNQKDCKLGDIQL